MNERDQGSVIRKLGVPLLLIPIPDPSARYAFPVTLFHASRTESFI
jgi:hypothetical protein